MAYNPASTAYDGSRIKAEPKNDDIEMLDAPPARRQLVPMNPFYPQSAAASSRAKDSKGDPSLTFCFHQVHLSHPHHHILKCGHDIMTRNVEQCGANCMVSDKAGEKPSGKVFECPHPSCVRQRAALRQKTVGRRCQLSHVYGRNLEADAARRIEKAKYEAAERVSLQEKVFKSKRSPSPEPSASHHPDRPAKSVRRKGKPSPEVQSVLSEIISNRNAEGLSKLAVETRKRKPDWDAIIMPTQDVRTETYDGHKCSCCEGRIEHVRFRCQQCEEVHSDEIDLCQDCYDSRDSRMWLRSHEHHVNEHQFMKVILGAAAARDRIAEMRRQPEDQDKDFEMLETFCTCNSTTVEHMMECEKCEKPFHPGCVGEGQHTDIQYKTAEDVEVFHEADIDALRNRSNKMPFLCVACKCGGWDEAVKEQASKQGEDDLAEMRRAYRQRNQSTNARNKKKRSADEAIDSEGPDMKELFGEEDDEDGDKTRKAKCAKTGEDVPTFGQWTLSMRVQRVAKRSRETR